MIKSKIVDSRGTGSGAEVTKEGYLTNHIASFPNKNESSQAFPFTEYFTNSGSNDMRVDGSSTPVEFTVEAKSDRDIWVKLVSPFISDPGARLDEFGNLPALTNGLDFKFKNDNLGEVIIQEEIQRNLDFFRFCHSTPGLGDGEKAFLLDISGGGGSDSYAPVMDFSFTHGLIYGLRLSKGSRDKLTFTVNDDLSTGITTFNIKAFGLQIL